ncbi:MAG: thiolase domain-containing protein [Candidatus Diapherotrites archaeon]
MVVIVGAGVTKFDEHWDLSFRELILDAAIKAISSSGLQGEKIEAIYGGCMASGRFIGQEHIGALIADQLGLNPIPSTRVEAACASGGVALRTAYLAIKSGVHDIVAVGGVEKMTELSTEGVSFALGGAGDQEIELFHGATFPSLYALLARAHMNEFGTTEEQMAAVAVKNHANAMLNPNAQFHRIITIEEVMKSGYVAEPIKVLDCSPITDGAAALILCSNQKAEELGLKGVEILASEQASDTLAITGRKSLVELKATRMAAQKAYKKTGLSPKDIDFAEVHDCFTIAEILAIEDLGFFEKGEGGIATEKGYTSLKGKIPINPSGGLKGKGHPVGATGVAQAVEAYYQLMGMAEERQVKKAKIGLSHNVGGSGATAVVTIYKKFKG